jgi:hypothetical protein
MDNIKKGDLCRIKYHRKRFYHEENGYLVIITDIDCDSKCRLYLVNGIWVKSGKMFNWEPVDFFEKIKQKT